MTLAKKLVFGILVPAVLAGFGYGLYEYTEITLRILGPASCGLLGLAVGYLVSNALVENKSWDFLPTVTLLIGPAASVYMAQFGDRRLTVFLFWFCFIGGYALYRYLLQMNLPRLKNLNADKPAPVFPWTKFDKVEKTDDNKKTDGKIDDSKKSDGKPKA